MSSRARWIRRRRGAFLVRRVTAINKYGFQTAETSATTLAPSPKFVFTIQPSGGSAGEVWAQQPEVALVDCEGKTIVSYNSDIELQAINGSHENAKWSCAVFYYPNRGNCLHLGGPTRARAVNGVAKFSGLFMKGAGAFRLQASETGEASKFIFRIGESQTFVIDGGRIRQFDRNENRFPLWQQQSSEWYICATREDPPVECYNMETGAPAGL